jgi:transposase-like protein
VRTTSGAVELERPRVRDASRLGFESRLLGKGVTPTCALEALVIGSFLRGLSTREVEAVLEETFEEPISSRSTVSRILEDTRERYRRWCARRLDGHDLVYLFLDAIYLKLHPDDEPAEGVLVAWGVTLEGRKVLLGLGLGSRESYESWPSFGRDLVARGLRLADTAASRASPQTVRCVYAPRSRHWTWLCHFQTRLGAAPRPEAPRPTTTPTARPRAAASTPPRSAHKPMICRQIVPIRPDGTASLRGDYFREK